ncbi:hypothetical protein SFRURICE_007711 [Spodoptera frugiperda]|nr:hypothetical protein SFRURICE_007711 [Spodoptera frugiperda]
MKQLELKSMLIENIGLIHTHNVTPFIPEGVGRGAHYGTLRATTDKFFRKSEKSPVILCPTRESNPRPLVRQSHLRPLDQRGSFQN